MDYKELATALYWSACDMDYEDYEETREYDIDCIALSLRDIDLQGGNVELLECLERIADTHGGNAPF